MPIKLRKPKRKPVRPRIITLTVRRMRGMAKQYGLILTSRHINALRLWADELDLFDARETRPDPSKRRRKAAR